MKNKALIMAIILIAMLMVSAVACTADIVTATTDVYVRSTDGDIVGMFRKGDKAVYAGMRKGYAKVEIDGKTYGVWGEYVTIDRDVDIEGVKMAKIRKSKSASEPVRGKTAHGIKGSIFEDVGFW